MSKSVDRAFVQSVGGQVMAAQLAGHRDPSGLATDHLDRLAEMSVRAAVALDGAIPRVEEKMAAEAKVAEEAAAVAAQEKAAAEKAAADTAKATVELQSKTAADAAAMQRDDSRKGSAPLKGSSKK